MTARLTARDRWLLHALFDHDVFTTAQIALATGTGTRSTQRTLRRLYDLGVLDSFRPYLEVGSAPEHYTLGPAGAVVLAAERAVDLKALGWRADRSARIAHSPWLGHDVARNDLMVRLAADHHTDAARRLTLWACERVCATLWGDHVHPDAYAHYRHHPPGDPGRGGGRAVAFFLEYDTGTTALARVDAKLAGYAGLAASTHPPTPTLVLIHTSTPRREAALRNRLQPTATTLGVPVATTHHALTDGGSPSDAVWLPLAGTAARTALLELPTHYRHPGPAPTAPGTWTPDPDDESNPGALRWPPAPPLPPTRTAVPGRGRG
ncbi:replication-relaxation family protein (plasmid) [Embleya sp. NBC_00888]|uniref:replication-relaxation family protein n=1 Tax=Embleya sp. NBC_00888 TaxID=2975960 RepID=UPI003867CECC|nr:replication-relaxation family protein [Embleya sp. NBC_00888]